MSDQIMLREDELRRQMHPLLREWPTAAVEEEAARIRARIDGLPEILFTKGCEAFGHPPFAFQHPLGDGGPMKAPPAGGDPLRYFYVFVNDQGMLIARSEIIEL